MARFSLLLLHLLTVLVPFAKAQTGRTSVTYTSPHRFLFDINGNQVDAYAASIEFFENRYFLYGNSFASSGIATGISVYSSVDLEDWKYEGAPFDTATYKSVCAPGKCVRPQIITTGGIYILWVNTGDNGYRVATSSSPSSGFTFQSSPVFKEPKFALLQLGDFSLGTGSGFESWEYSPPGVLPGFLAFTVINYAAKTRTLWVTRLTNDYTNQNATRQSHQVYSSGSSFLDSIDLQISSPHLYYDQGWYYIIASSTCDYCSSSKTIAYRSQNITSGPWIRQIISNTSCNAEVEGVLTLNLPGSNIAAHAWHGTSIQNGRPAFSGHIFYALGKLDPDSTDGLLTNLNCSDIQSITGSPGTDGIYNIQNPPVGEATNATDESPLIADYYAVCDSNVDSLYQTWQSSKTGILEQVSVNIAASTQRLPLTLELFSVENLLGPTMSNAIWTSLFKADIAPSSLSHVFNIASIFPNVAVQQGDNLAIKISSNDAQPYCHLEYQTGETVCSYDSQFSRSRFCTIQNQPSPYILLQQARGTSGVKKLVERDSTVKFFATVR